MAHINQVFILWLAWREDLTWLQKTFFTWSLILISRNISWNQIYCYLILRQKKKSAGFYTSALLRLPGSYSVSSFSNNLLKRLIQFIYKYLPYKPKTQIYPLIYTYIWSKNESISNIRVNNFKWVNDQKSKVINP